MPRAVVPPRLAERALNQQIAAAKREAEVQAEAVAEAVGAQIDAHDIRLDNLEAPAAA